MTLNEFVTALKATGLPVAYSHFKSTPENPAPPPPFICYIESPSANLFADNKTYKKVNGIQVELYTEKKDLSAESTLESLLDSHEIPYETSEIYINSENMFQKIYEVRLI